jgi:hypothetical protein
MLVPASIVTFIHAAETGFARWKWKELSDVEGLTSDPSLLSMMLASRSAVR